MHTYAHTYICAYIRSLICTYIHMHTHTYAHTYICTYIHMHIHTHAHTYICTYIHMHIHTYSNRAVQVALSSDGHQLVVGYSDHSIAVMQTGRILRNSDYQEPDVKKLA